MSLLEKSFSLIRTNPKLTGNVKLVVASDQKLYLESFSINKTLKKDKYKHFRIKPEEYYKEVIPVFFEEIEDKGIFEVKRESDVAEVYDKFAFQFDDTYYSGGQFVEDNWYQEEFEYHAPLYIKRDAVPKGFMILRIDGSGSLTEQSTSNNFRDQIIDNWKFLTSFDLTDESEFGGWFQKNFINDETLPVYPLEIKHSDIDFSTISGLDVKYGGWVTKSSNLREFQSKNSPFFKSEERITNLFEENKVLYPDIVNLKFLFDDTPATPDTLRKYTINRYIGFYYDDQILLDSVYSYSGFDLNKVPTENLEEMTAIEISEIPYLRNNVFVREINGRFYSFDPIKNGWTNNQTYWVEFNYKFYRLERIENVVEDLFATDVIIGDFLYRIISDTNIEHPVDSSITDPSQIKQIKKVLINELSQDEKRMKVTPKTEFNNITALNLIENINTLFTTLTRLYDVVNVSGVDTLLFRIQLDSALDNNLFSIENFDEADLHLIQIANEFYVIKQYPTSTSNVGGKYYLNTDYAIRLDNLRIERWINEGNITENTEFWQRRDIEHIPLDEEIPFYKIFRINFTDIKDFDFERIETDYSKYEYEKEFEVKDNIEPKLYAKEFRDVNVEINTIDDTEAKRIAVLDINDRALFIRDQNGELNPFTGNPYTAEELYFKDEDDQWALFESDEDIDKEWKNYNVNTVDLRRDFYREENYVFRIEDESELVLVDIDYRIDSDSTVQYEELTFDIDGKSEISTEKAELEEISSKDPRREVDTHYVPASSEYVATDELWEIKNNDLTPIWDKNQSVCKWGFVNSNGTHDYPYRLNYNLDIAGATNKEPNRNTNREYPERDELNLDYFYRFGLNTPEQYQNYNLHLNETHFDIDKYFSTDFNYFDYLFKTDQITDNGIKLTNKYSVFEIGNSFNDAFTLFKGVKYRLTDVTEIIIDEEELEDSGTLLIEDVITKANPKYKNYKFSIVFGRKLSSFSNNPGNGNSNMGIDIYLNDYWKNIVVHLFINTDEVLQITDSVTKEFINAETTEIDEWYEDNLDKEEIDPVKWAESEFKINNFSIGLRPRDFMLWEFINILENFNYEPTNLPKEEIQFIHIYEDGTSKTMNYTNTDFSVMTEEPKEFLVKEESFITTAVSDDDIPDFDINNTLANRKIVEDDPNNPDGSPDFSIDGLRVDSVNDINTYNDYPIAKEINENLVDTRENWLLEDETDTSLFRYDGPYIPIFKQIPLFRPLGYKNLKEQVDSTPILPIGNWKFYDPNSDLSNPDIVGFGIIEELLFSKVNRTSNPLKIDDPDDKERSIYPMVDEYGYDYDARYVFTSNWEPSFYYESKFIEVPPNEQSGISGFTIHYDGIKEFLRIPDQQKFNLERYIVDNVNFESYILTEPTIGEKNGFTQELDIDSSTETGFIDMKLLANRLYNFDINWVSTGSGVSSAEYRLEIQNDPEKATQTGDKFMHESTADNLSGNWTNDSNKQTFITSRYETVSTSSNTTYPTVPTLGLPNVYIEDMFVNVKLVFLTDSTNSSKINITVNMIADETGHSNFLLMNIGEDENENGFILPESTTNSWNGFFKKKSQTGDILNFSKTITDWNIAAGITSNLAYDNNIISTGSAPDFQISNGFKNHIPVDIIKTQKTTYFSITPVLPSPPLPETVVTQGDIDNTPISNYGRFASLLDDSNDLYDVLKDDGYYTFMDYRNDNNPIIRISNAEAFQFEPDRQTYIKDGKSLIYVQEKTGTLTQPYIVLQWYKTYRDGYIEFDIKPDNGNTVNIKSRIRHRSNRSRLSVNEVIIELNNNLNDTIYFAQRITDPSSSSHYEKIIIKVGGDDSSIVDTSPLNPNNVTPAQVNSPLKGSYYNFSVDIRTKNDIKVDSGPIISSSEETITQRFNKTSLKEGSKRMNKFVNEYTIEFFVKTDNWSRDWETILYKGQDTTDDPWLNDDFTDFTFIIGKFDKQNKLAFKTSHLKLDGTKTVHLMSSEIEINDGEWHHVAFITNLLERTKTIMVDGIIDSVEEDYLEPRDDNNFVVDDTPEEREMVAQFLDNRERFLPGIVHPSMGVDSTLANKIRINSQDSHTLYWYDAIRGLKNIERFDAEFQQKEWGATVVDGYATFEENYKAMDYYLNIDPDAETDGELNWDILIGTDSSLANGRRNFEGFIDELRIWNYARSEEQITNNYRYILRVESQLDPLNSLVAYYRFDEGQGVNLINDLMSDKLIADISRWARVETILSDNGKKEVESDNIDFFQFEQSYYTGANIDIDDDEIDWDVSGADIIGFSDERNVLPVPFPITTQTSREREEPIFKRTKQMLRKRRKRRLIFNVNVRIFKISRRRSFRYNSFKWWLFKRVSSRVKERLNSTKVRFRIRRKGKDWLTKIRRLTRKRR